MMMCDILSSLFQLFLSHPSFLPFPPLFPIPGIPTFLFHFFPFILVVM